MTDPKEIYVVFVYCDYRKEVDVQHIKAFTNREKAIEFAKKYEDAKKEHAEYVCIEGTEYDAKFWYPNENDYDENDMDKYKNDELKYQSMLAELNIKKDMWYLRIAVSKVPF